MPTQNNISTLPQNNFTLNSVVIRGMTAFADVTSNISELNIYESLDSLMCGELYILDVSGITDILNMTGDEGIDIQFSSKKGDALHATFKKSFRVTDFYKMNNKLASAEVVCIKFCNQATIENNLIKKSKAYVNKSSSSIIKDLLSNFQCLASTTLNIEDTLYQRDFVSGWATPFSIIHTLLESSASKTTNSCKFFFYEDRDAINITSLSTLKAKPPIYTLINEADSYKKHNSGYGTDIIANRMHLIRGANVTDSTKSGDYGVRVYTHSLINKTIKIYDLTNTTFAAELPPMNSVDLIQSEEMETYAKPFNSIAIEPADGFYSYSGRPTQGHMTAIRTMEETKIDKKIIFAEIPGNTDLTVGNTVTINAFSLYDPVKSYNISGKWIINKIKHRITTKVYLMELELITDSKLDGGKSL